MARELGRTTFFYLGSGSSKTLIGGGRTKSWTKNNEPVDVTNDDDEGFATILAEPGQHQVTFSFEGIVINDTLRSQMLSAPESGGHVLQEITVEFPEGDELVGDFFLGSYAENLPYNEGRTFTLEAQSSGEWTYSAAS